MNTIHFLQHIVEPNGLLLTWQPTNEQAQTRTRRVVGEVRVQNGQAVFRYLSDTADYKAAERDGFVGFPAFDIKQEEISRGVIESLMRRLPPRKRDDFSAYLAQHRLPEPFVNSDIALLGYTGARLPSDGFALVPDFPLDTVPCDFLIEVAGVRHVYGASVEDVMLGDEVSFEIDVDNPVDADAVVVLHQGRRLGYINRALRKTFICWLEARSIEASIERLNGKPGRPLIYVRVSVS